jgi:hypothetical protein
MEVLSQNEMSDLPDLGHRLRQLRWFRRAFESCVHALEARYGLKAKIAEDVLAEVFMNWVETIDHQKSLARLDRSDFITFSGGMMLCELIQRHPVTVELSRQNIDDMPEAAAFWPEGFLYTNFCISAVAAVHRQEFGATIKLADCVDDLRTWWSFRENTQEMPSYAIAFLDRFVGAEPNWIMPERAGSRAAMLAAAARGRSLDTKHNTLGSGKQGL